MTGLINDENAVQLLGKPKPPSPEAQSKTLEKWPIGQRVSYSPARAGSVVDVSLCGLWVLVLRDYHGENERPNIAVLATDPDLQEILAGWPK